MKPTIPIFRAPPVVPKPVVRNAPPQGASAKPDSRKAPKKNQIFNPQQPQQTPEEQPITFSVALAEDISINTSSTMQAFDVLANIKIDEPSIIALTEFLPCYEQNDKLNSAGEFFQAKQAALLVSCVDSVKNILSLIKDQKSLEDTNQSTIKKDIKNAKIEIFEFCQKFENNISSISTEIEGAKKAFNFKIDFSSDVIKNLIEKLKVPIDLQVVSSMEDMTNCPSDKWQKWTATKTWLQMCLELKNALQTGVSSNQGLFFTGVPSVVNIDSPYLLNKHDIVENKITFNKNQTELMSMFDGTLEIKTDNFVLLKTRFNKIFTTANDSILSVSIQDFIGSKDIARLSYLITKELNYSTELRSLGYANSSVLTRYSYPSNNLDKENNTAFWNHVVGKTGTDITEIPNNQYSQNSLTALSQRIEGQDGSANKYEVLAFESAYVNDNINSNNQVKRNSILTPGSAYYIDATLSPESLFDPQNAKLYLVSVNNAVNSLKDIFSTGGSQFLFDENITPRTKDDFFFTTYAKPNNQQSEINKALRNPILLVRFLENRLLTNTFLARSSNPPNVKFDEDISQLLVSFALTHQPPSGEDSLLSLLYMYVLTKVNSKMRPAILPSVFGTDDIIQKIKDYLVTYFDKNNGTGADFQDQDTQLFLDVINSNKLRLLDNVADVLFSIGNEFNFKDTPDFIVANPFTVTTPSKSFYSGIQKESIMTLLFFLCCLMIHEVSWQSIVNMMKEGGKRTLIIRKDKEPTLIEEQFYINNPNNPPGGITLFNVYNYDHVIFDAERKMWDETIHIKKMSSWFVCYLSILENKLTNFVDQLEEKAFNSEIYLPILSILNDDEINTLKVFGEGQLGLIKSKLSYMKTRLSPGYDSKLKMLAPYFVSLKNEDSFILNAILPLEDSHIASWNYLLQESLKKEKFKSPAANNVKILSVGIPQMLYQKLQKPVNADILSSAIGPLSIVSINVYLIDNLRPMLIHKPQRFIFNLKKFPTRLLNNYLANKNLLLDQVAVAAAATADKLAYYSILDDGDIKKLNENHADSFFLEEYLRFIAGVSFDEQSFYNFEKDAKSISASSIGIFAPSAGAIEYLKETIFVDNDTIKKMLISPKKFDRVFHIAFDPDDFEINQELTTTFNGINIIEYYSNLGIIVKKGNDYKRVASISSEIEFNSYRVELEVIA